MAILQFGMGSYLAYLYNDKGLLNKPITLTTTNVTKSPSNNKFVLDFQLGNSDQIFIAQETIAFFFVTGIFHSIYALTHNNLYRSMITYKNNYLRWIEYSISATLMMRIIALQCGIRDRDTLGLITSSMVGVMLMGQIVEVSLAHMSPIHNDSRKQTAIVASIIGWLLMVSVFVIVVRKFIELKDNVDSFGCPNVAVPDFVLAIIVSQLVFYSTFGFIQMYHVYQRVNNKYVNYINIEKLYIIDSLLAKLTLGGILAYSVVQADQGVYSEFKC